MPENRKPRFPGGLTAVEMLALKLVGERAPDSLLEGDAAPGSLVAVDVVLRIDGTIGLDGALGQLNVSRVG